MQFGSFILPHEINSCPKIFENIANQTATQVGLLVLLLVFAGFLLWQCIGCCMPGQRLSDLRLETTQLTLHCYFGFSWMYVTVQINLVQLV